MKEFLSIQPRGWKTLYSLYYNTLDKTPEERRAIIKNYLVIEKGFTEEHAEQVTAKVLKTFTEELPAKFVENDETQEARLSLQDIKLLKEKLFHEPSAEVRRLLVSFLVFARANPHPSFWIKNDKKVINFLASIDKMRTQDQILLTNRLHTLYNLDMQVVGSNQPIACFRISWQAEQSPIDSDDNPGVLIGPLNPATIKLFVESIPYEEEKETTANGYQK